MPVQLTLRHPKGGAILAERVYDDGYRIDAVSGWLVVVDRNGSVVAAHAACPGLEGRTVEHASAAAPVTAAVVAPDEDEDRFAEELMLDLRRLGDTYGPLGVAIAAATLTDPQVLVAQIVDEHGGAEVLQGVRPPDEDPPDGYEANLDALRAEVARLTGLLDDAGVEADRADEATSTLATYRREVDEQTARAEHEHAERLRLERVVAERNQTIDTLRGHLDAATARAERAEGLVEPVETVRAPIEEDPHRPHPDSWPDDAVLLRYVELRRLVALHLERYGDARSARAMLDGDVPLRLSEVLA